MYHKNLLKLICLLAGFFCLNQNISAQIYPEFAPVGAQWTYVQYNAFYYPTIRKMHSDSATVVLGKDCKDLGDFYAYRDSMKTFIYRKNKDTAWQLFWDYGWPVNHIAAVPTIQPYGDDTVVCAITFKGDTTIGGFTFPLHRYTFDSVGNTYTQRMTTVMNIGNVDDYFLPQRPMHVTDVPTFDLRCYEDTVIGSVKAPGTVVCDTNYVSVATVSMPEFKIYPNPATDLISIENNSTNGTLQLINVLGQTVLTAPVQKGYSKIPLSGLMPGIYSYKLMANGTLVEKGKLSVHP